MAEPGSYQTQCEDGVYRTHDERMAWLAGKKQAKAEAAKEAGIEALLWDNLSKWKKSITEGVGRLLGEKFAEEKAALKRALADMREGIAAQQGKAQQELRDHVEAELSLAIKDVRSTHEGIERQAERIAGRAAERACERAVVNLMRDVDELRAELAELKAERQQLRAIK